jgi:hypothetical protein
MFSIISLWGGKPTMPYFAKKVKIGGFEVTVKPQGKIHSKWIVNKWIPYFSQNFPKVELIVDRQQPTVFSYNLSLLSKIISERRFG